MCRSRRSSCGSTAPRRFLRRQVSRRSRKRRRSSPTPGSRPSGSRARPTRRRRIAAACRSRAPSSPYALATAPPQAHSVRSAPARLLAGGSGTRGRARWRRSTSIASSGSRGASTADVATLLGRAIAHELGHLLLGTPQHGRFGVMRAIWSSQMVRNSRPAEWRFSVARGETDARCRQRPCGRRATRPRQLTVARDVA